MNFIARLMEKGLQFDNVIVCTGIAVAVGILLHAVYAAFSSQRKSRIRGSWIARLVYLVFATLVVALTATSFGSILTAGVMEHWALLAHIAIAGAFVFVLLVFSIAWSPLKLSNANVDGQVSADTIGNAWWLSRWSLWCVLWASLVVAGSMLVAMLPIFDTIGMHEITMIHRYAGLVLAGSLMVNLYAFAAQRLGWR
ncbi:MAG: hypothetical protein SGI77_19240 [Pirellulaceae bacterium]|nr:hypothetical protein [Pirellulaceae bacterium]